MVAVVVPKQVGGVPALSSAVWLVVAVAVAVPKQVGGVPTLSSAVWLVVAVAVAAPKRVGGVLCNCCLVLEGGCSQPYMDTVISCKIWHVLIK